MQLVGRNGPCPCGSGKRYKDCHGAIGEDWSDAKATQRVLQQALAAQQAGKLREAESLYQQAIDAEPDNFDAVHMLGVVEFGQGRFDRSLKLLRRAVELRPDVLAAWQNLRLVESIPRMEHEISRAILSSPRSLANAAFAVAAKETAACDLRVVAFHRYASGASGTQNTSDDTRDWTRICEARANFAGHAQPHRPLVRPAPSTNESRTVRVQAELAQRFGISAFCYFCQWSEETPPLVPHPSLMAMQTLPERFAYAVCWETGPIDPVLASMQEVDALHIFTLDESVDVLRSLLPLLSDDRYLRINGRPLLLISEPAALPPNRTWRERWRAECDKAGIPTPYLVCFGLALGADPALSGFDAAVEFPPTGAFGERVEPSLRMLNPRFRGEVRSYLSVAAQIQSTDRPGHRLFRTVLQGWDNTPLTQDSALTYVGNSPEAFEWWVNRAVQQTRLRFSGDERLLFVRSWNEWEVGCHLEPDLQHGHLYLEALQRGLATAPVDLPARPSLDTLKKCVRRHSVRTSRTENPSSSISLLSRGPSVTVVMPAYNHERFVEHALDSVIAQTHRDLEIIVVDDGSSDRTGDMLDEYASRCVTHPITVVHQRNAGAHEAINHGLALAKGELIALMNSDDLYAPARLERMIARMRESGSDFAFSDTRFIDDQGRECVSRDAYILELRQAIDATKEDNPLFAFMMTNVAISTGNFVFTRRLLDHTGGLCNMRVCHDWDFVLAASYATPLCFVREPLYLYRLHSTNTFAGLKLQGGMEIEQLRARFFADIMRHPIMQEPLRARRFVEHALRCGLAGFLPGKAIELLSWA